METNTDKQAWLDALVLEHGSHEAAEKGLCVMEAVAYFAGEEHSDRPKCASKVATKFAMRLNDNWNDTRRQKLKAFIPKLVGTAASAEVESKRAYMCADWACRELLPDLFEHLKIGDWATQLRALVPVVDEKTAGLAKDLARKARDAADAADAADAYAYADAAAYAAAYATAAYKTLGAKSDAMSLELLQRLIDVKE